ncbi:MAG: hypothetical protein MI749_02120 [Desulfovibrionales bacterium]|nr:hypothetical protein [Desulfovibrionales bacterium]
MKKRILVIEGDLNVLDYMLNFLQSADFDGAGAESLDAACTIAARTPFDLIMLDTNLTGASIATVCASLTSTPCNQNTPFLFIGGSEDRSVPGSTVVAAMKKPFDPDRLLTIIRQTLED